MFIFECYNIVTHYKDVLNQFILILIYIHYYDTRTYKFVANNYACKLSLTNAYYF